MTDSFFDFVDDKTMVISVQYLITNLFDAQYRVMRVSHEWLATCIKTAGVKSLCKTQTTAARETGARKHRMDHQLPSQWDILVC